jgi:photosystem II stability/assembly factor-like uncharacterized protein
MSCGFENRMVFVFLFLLTQTAFAQWSILSTDATLHYNQVLFVNDLKGYIVGQKHNVQHPDSGGFILITTDGGQSWFQRIISSDGISAVSAIGNNLVWVTTIGKVYYSNDGCITWKWTSAWYPSAYFQTIQFVDSLNGWLTGYCGMFDGILHSTDGGPNWTIQYTRGWPGDFAYMKQGSFPDKIHGWAVTKYSVLRTTNGGSTWFGQSVVPTNDYLKSIFFLDSLRGWAGGFRSISKTEDGGATWITGYDAYKEGWDPAPWFTSLFFADKFNGWACSNSGRIFCSRDGGLSWSVQYSDTSGEHSLNSIFMLDKNNGWAVGNGILLHTTNGGVTSLKEQKQQSFSFSLAQNYPNPFNSTTIINYRLCQNCFVTLKVLDILGKEIEVLINEYEPEGPHMIRWDASMHPSGVYFYKLTASSEQNYYESMKYMMFIK